MPHPLPLSPPSAVFFRAHPRPSKQQPRPKSFYDRPDDHDQLRYFEGHQGHQGYFEPQRDTSSPFYQRINNNRHSFAAFEDDPTPTNSPPPRPPPKAEGREGHKVSPKAAEPTAVPLLPRRYNSGFSPIEDRLKDRHPFSKAWQ